MSKTAETPNKEGNPLDFDEFVPWAAKKLRFSYAISMKRKFKEPSFTSRRALLSKGTKGTATSKASATLKASATSKASKLERDQKNELDHYSYSDKDLKKLDSNDDDTVTERLTITTTYDKNNDLVQILFDKQQHIHTNMLCLIKLIVEFHPHLRRVTINKGLADNSLYELSDLISVSNIREVFLDDTNITPANYDILLDETNDLQVLSLSRCQLKDDALKRIADKLHYPKKASQQLSVLDVSSNLLTNKSAEYLAAALRMNRKLAYLNLAGNKISDDGGIAIFNVLVSFPCTSEEEEDYRHSYMDFMKKEEAFKREMNTYADSHIAIAKSASQRKKLKNDASSHKRVSSISQASSRKKSELLAQKILGSFTHPLQDSIDIDGVRYSSGNTSLVYLGLAYNNLTYLSLKAAIKAIQYQQSQDMSKGLKTLRLEGNLLPKQCPEYSQLTALLERGLRGFGHVPTSSINMSKKPKK